MSNRIESDYFSVSFSDSYQIGIFELEDVFWLFREGRAFTRAAPISKSGEHAVFKIVKNCEGYDYIPCSFVQLFSTRVSDFLRREANCEFVDFIALNGTVLVKDPGYSLFHAMDVFEAVDHEKSELLMWNEEAGGGIRKIRTLFLKWDIIGSSEVFVLNDAQILCVSRRIRDRLLEIGVKGFRFRCLDDIAAEYL